MGDEAFAALLARARGGDPRAREELARLMSAEAHAQAHRRLGARLRRRMESIDVSQAAVVEALQRLDRFRGTTPRELGAWLGLHVLNHIRDAADYHGAQKRALDRERRLATGLPLAAGGRGALAGTPSAHAAKGERVATLRAAVARLPDGDRLLVELFERGESWERVAEFLGHPSADAARKRCARVLRGMADELEPLA